MGRIENKVVVVTGGARGIGHAICLLFAREGAAVAVTDVIDDEGRQVVDLIKEKGGKADFWHLDTSREENVVQVFSEVADQWGGASTCWLITPGLRAPTNRPIFL
jgi:NAD(P)-dependent dehydrogenase (short-subunit alcohol dehydrogenase family)